MAVLTSTKHRAFDFGVARDGHLGIFGHSLVKLVCFTFATAIHVTANKGVAMQAVVADHTARDGHIKIAIFTQRRGLVHLHDTVIIHTHSSLSTTAEHRAEQIATRHSRDNVTTHTAYSAVYISVVTTATEDIAVITRDAVGTNGTITKGDIHAIEHMAVFAAAENGAPNTATRNVDHRFVDITKPFVVINKVINGIGIGDGFPNALAAAEEVAIQAIEAFASIGFRSRAQLTACEVDRGNTRSYYGLMVGFPTTCSVGGQTHAGHLAATVNII